MRLILQNHQELQMLQEVAIMTFLKISSTRVLKSCLDHSIKEAQS